VSSFRLLSAVCTADRDHSVAVRSTRPACRRCRRWNRRLLVMLGSGFVVCCDARMGDVTSVAFVLTDHPCTVTHCPGVGVVQPSCSRRGLDRPPSHDASGELAAVGLGVDMCSVCRSTHAFGVARSAANGSSGSFNDSASWARLPSDASSSSPSASHSSPGLPWPRDGGSRATVLRRGGATGIALGKCPWSAVICGASRELNLSLASQRGTGRCGSEVRTGRRHQPSSSCIDPASSASPSSSAYSRHLRTITEPAARSRWTPRGLPLAEAAIQRGGAAATHIGGDAGPAHRRVATAVVVGVACSGAAIRNDAVVGIPPGRGGLSRHIRSMYCFDDRPAASISLS